MDNRPPVTRLVDERFVGAVLSPLREVGETIERRKKLECKPPRAASRGPQTSSPAADGGRPKKNKGSGRGGKADGKAGGHAARAADP